VAVSELTTDELRSALETHKPLTILDVRPAAERAEWSIPGSQHVDAYTDLRQGDPSSVQNIASSFPKDVPVVTVCARGRTSLLAAQVLDGLGFQVYSLRGGMAGWSEAWNTAEVALPVSGLRAIQVRRTGKGCLAYILASGSEAAVVDPSVDASVFQQLARDNGWRIVAVLDTHVHADHVSRAYALGAVTGAPVYLPRQQRVSLPFTPIDDGQEIKVGATTIKAIRTPGHTHESTCYLFGNAALCTGDTLFLHGVGRPDLKAAGDESRVRAGLLYHSLIERVLPLPGTLVVLPGHTSAAVPFDGVAHADTLEHVRSAISLAALPESAFVSTILARIPANPPNHLTIVRINEGVEPMPTDLLDLEAGANRCAINS
jgi:glyoxylase-like metal-dependent hydrolase (beta-lactamase superfamily II)/rhodanese-related sulfurtransferase